MLCWRSRLAAWAPPAAGRTHGQVQRLARQGLRPPRHGLLQQLTCASAPRPDACAAWRPAAGRAGGPMAALCGWGGRGWHGCERGGEERFSLKAPLCCNGVRSGWVAEWRLGGACPVLVASPSTTRLAAAAAGTAPRLQCLPLAECAQPSLSQRTHTCGVWIVVGADVVLHRRQVPLHSRQAGRQAINQSINQTRQAGREAGRSGTCRV